MKGKYMYVIYSFILSSFHRHSYRRAMSIVYTSRARVHRANSDC